MIDLLIKLLRQCFINWRFCIKNHAIIENGVKLTSDSTLEGKNRICKNSSVVSTHIGYASYIGENVALLNTWVGRYSCIGPEVQVIRGEHPTDTFVSIHPAFYSLKRQSGFTYVTEQLFSEYRYADAEKRYNVIVGNDVWIGAGVRLLNGIKIGDGAIIATGAVVTENVLPYSIVGGIPAKLLKKRFTEDDIDWLLQLQWWDKNEEWISCHSSFFRNIDQLKAVLGMEIRQ